MISRDHQISLGNLSNWDRVLTVGMHFPSTAEHELTEGLFLEHVAAKEVSEQ